MTVTVITPYGGTDPHRAALYLWTQARNAALLPTAERIASTDHGHDVLTFSRARAVNRAARAATGDVFLIADADMIIDPVVIDAGLQLLDDGAPWVVPYTDYRQLRQDDTAIILSQPPADPVETPDRWQWRGDLPPSPRAPVCGLVLVRECDFRLVGGYDERFVGWGWEDRSFAHAMTTLVGDVARVDAVALHLWHSQHPARKQNPVSRALGQRYRRAADNQPAMRDLVSTRP